MADLYPPSVTGVPADLTLASPKYRQAVVVVLIGLILFLLFYLALVAASGWLLYLAIIFPLPEVNRATVLLKFGSIGAAGMLFLFLVKGLFKRQMAGDDYRIEVTEAEQPELFGFIRRLCEETGAPFPYRVFVSPEVNAAVFYNTSLLNLIFPTRKNLLIGLGLVNGLTLDEFKAVLAHEFGHFSQSSMRLGRYVYQANRIIADMVFGRDKWDATLAKWRRLDFRIAIFAWILYGIIWVLRKILEGAFRLINFVEASLSREMEFHADLVAVSITGSDSLIHALRRLELAGEALSEAMDDLKTASDHQLYTRDIFYHQSCAAEHVRRVKNEPAFGEPPALPANPSEKVQVFQPGEGGIPSMWASHPANHDREENAKRRYFRSPLDPRSPWILFRNAEQLRERMTRELYQKGLEIPGTSVYQDPTVVQAFIDEERVETTYDPRYHGLYDSRFVEPGDVPALVQSVHQTPWDANRIAATMQRLYGGELKEWLEQYRQRQGEEALLEGLKKGDLGLRGKTFTFREKEHGKNEVPQLLEQVEKELEADRNRLKDLDRAVFLAHYQIAARLLSGDHEQLYQRYCFHVAVQDILREVSGAKAKAEYMLKYLSSQDQVSEADIKETVRILRESRGRLLECLTRASTLALPALRNLPEGHALSGFLLSEPLAADIPADSKSITGEWAGQLMRQLDGVQTKARRIHFKSLGAILALQEKIAGEWHNLATAPPTPAA